MNTIQTQNQYYLHGSSGLYRGGGGGGGPNDIRKLILLITCLGIASLFRCRL